MFQSVFEGGIENVGLHHFEGIFKTPPQKHTKTIPRGVQRPILHVRGVPEKISCIFVTSPLKSSLKGVVIIYIYIYMHIDVHNTIQWVIINIDT